MFDKHSLVVKTQDRLRVDASVEELCVHSAFASVDISPDPKYAFIITMNTLDEWFGDYVLVSHHIVNPSHLSHVLKSYGMDASVTYMEVEQQKRSALFLIDCLRESGCSGIDNITALIPQLLRSTTQLRGT